MPALPPIAEMERAYLAKDAAYEGLFFLAVRTTGIFCRPVCPARKPLPKNVEYFPHAAAALAAGYRPCKRCRPLGADDQAAWAAALQAEADAAAGTEVDTAELRRRGLDPATVRRHFQKRFGMTFHEYSRARRLSKTFRGLRAGRPLDTAPAATGYASASGFRAAFEKTFGVAPGAARAGACVLLTWLPSPLGPLIAGATDGGVCLLEFTDRRMIDEQFATLRRRFALPLVPGINRHLELLARELAEYFAGRLRAFTAPLDFPGTDFQRRVWQQLLAIPYGETRSYEELAIAAGTPKGCRAVGRANGLNRIAIVIPCHRVVNKDGALGGYGGGLHRKQFLLDLEQHGPATPEKR